MVLQPNMGKATGNDQWITDNEVSDPAVLPEIPGYHILIRPLSVRSETKGGIIMPDSLKDDIQYLFYLQPFNLSPQLRLLRSRYQ